MRGRVIPVVDLRERMGYPVQNTTKKSRILVTLARGRTIGLLVDRVDHVRQLDRLQVTDPPGDVMTSQSEYIVGMGDSCDHGDPKDLYYRTHRQCEQLPFNAESHPGFELLRHRVRVTPRRVVLETVGKNSVNVFQVGRRHARVGTSLNNRSRGLPKLGGRKEVR